jgi:diguanylate cyclase (GGDEF)-like protein
LSKPDFRTAATVRLKAERSKSLSAEVLRLIHADSASTGETVPDQRADQSPATRPAALRNAGEIGAEVGTLRTWNAAVQHEERRLARYRGPVTLVVAELHGLEAVAARLGDEAAETLAHGVGTAIRRTTRACDVVARHGSSRFLAMLPETDEVAAINCVERVRSECEANLLGGGVVVARLAIGWAQAGAGGRIADAVRLAEARMQADRRRGDAATARSSR